MSTIYRRSYREQDLDPIDGRCPEYGNPGAVAAASLPPDSTPCRSASCPGCTTSWNRLVDGDACWNCGQVPAALLRFPACSPG